MSRFGSSDHQLLVDDIFSDCEVVCEDQTWKLHRNILCTRSNYFKGPLLHNWQESKTKQVVITEFSKKQVDWLIKFIYTGEADFDAFEGAGTIMDTCVQLWILGDYFLVPSMCEAAMDYLSREIIPRNARIAAAQNFSLNGTDWHKAGRRIYGRFPGDHPLKDAFLEITLGKFFVRKEALNMLEFKSMCLLHSEFGNDCMLKLVEDGTTRIQ